MGGWALLGLHLQGGGTEAWRVKHPAEVTPPDVRARGAGRPFLEAVCVLDLQILMVWIHMVPAVRELADGKENLPGREVGRP